MDLLEGFLNDIEKNGVQKNAIIPISLVALKQLFLFSNNGKKRKFDIDLNDIADTADSQISVLLTMLYLDKKGFITINKIDIYENEFNDRLLESLSSSIKKKDKKNLKLLSALVKPQIIKLLEGNILPSEMDEFINRNEKDFFNPRGFETELLNNLYMKISFNKNQYDSVQNVIDKYVEALQKDELFEFINPRYNFREKEFLEEIEEILYKKSPKNIHLNACSSLKEIREKEYDFHISCFFELLLSIEKKSLLKIIHIYPYGGYRNMKNLSVICDIDEEKLRKASGIIRREDINNITNEDEKNKESEEDEEDVFSYDGGISTGYENTDLELFILKKILIEHKRRDDAGFFAKELSFNNNSLEDICRVINRLMEDKILYLSANTRPERFEKEGIEGIDGKDGFINWKLVEKLDKNQEMMNSENGCVIFDTYILDEIKLKGRLDIAIDEFMNDKIFTPLGYLADKQSLAEEMKKIRKSSEYKKSVYNTVFPKNITLPYLKQREIVLRKISKYGIDDININLIDNEQGIDFFKTLLALEKENVLRIKEINSNPVYNEKEEFVAKWNSKDNPNVRIEIIKKEEIKTVLEKVSVYTIVENGIGYFKFNKRGEKIKIGGENTRQFRLLRLMCNPVDTARTIEGIFDSIKIPRDSRDSALNSYNNYQSDKRKLEIIKFTIKEIQKIKKVQGKLKFIYDENQKTYRLKVN